MIPLIPLLELFVKRKVRTTDCNDSLIDIIHQLASEGRYGEAKIIATQVRMVKENKGKRQTHNQLTKTDAN